MIIRRMTANDAPQVHQIEIACFGKEAWSLQSFIDEAEKNVAARYLVCEDNGRILAYAGAWLIFEEGHITNIAVDASARGEGIGKKITQALMQYAANLCVQYMTLEVRRSNLVAQSLYKSVGFIELGVRKRYYEDNGEDALLMVCDHMPPVEEDFSE